MAPRPTAAATSVLGEMSAGLGAHGLRKPLLNPLPNNCQVLDLKRKAQNPLSCMAVHNSCAKVCCRLPRHSHVGERRVPAQREMQHRDTGL